MAGEQFDVAWNQQPGEASKWYERFLIYRDMGIDRKFFHAYTLYLRQAGKYEQAEKAKDTPGAWKVKAIKFAWQLRAERWDQEERKKRQAWKAKKLVELQEEELRLGFIMLKEGAKMLEWPLTERTVEDDGKTIIFTPAGWNKGTAYRYLRTGSEISRRALGVAIGGQFESERALEGQQPEDQRDFDDIDWLVDAMPDLAPAEDE